MAKPKKSTKPIGKASPKKVAKAAGKPKTAKPKAAAPGASAATRTHLIEVGSRYSLRKIVDFATSVLAIVSAHAGFATFGFDATWVTAMQKEVDALVAQSKSVEAAQGDTLPGAEAVLNAIADAKAWRRNAATSVMLTPGLAHTFSPSGSSVPALMRSVTSLLPLVGDARATKFGGGPAVKKAGAALLSTLESARARHVAEIAKLTPALKDLQASKGAIYEALNRLARAARTVVPEESKAFATSTHLGSRRAGAGKATPVTPVTPVTPTAPVAGTGGAKGS